MCTLLSRTLPALIGDFLHGSTREDSPNFSISLYVLGHDARFLDSFFELVFADAKFLSPVIRFPIFMHIDAVSISANALQKIVCMFAPFFLRCTAKFSIGRVQLKWPSWIAISARIIARPQLPANLSVGDHFIRFR